MMFFVKADQRVLRHLISSYVPDIDNALKNHDIGQQIIGSVTSLLSLILIIL